MTDLTLCRLDRCSSLHESAPLQPVLPAAVGWHTRVITRHALHLIFRGAVRGGGVRGNYIFNDFLGVVCIHHLFVNLSWCGGGYDIVFCCKYTHTHTHTH